MDQEFPKKILIIKDASFILPDDFEGNVDDALQEFIEYRANRRQDPSFASNTEVENTFDLLTNNQQAKFAGQYAVFEYIDDQYVLMDNTDRK